MVKTNSFQRIHEVAGGRCLDEDFSIIIRYKILVILQRHIQEIITLSFCKVLPVLMFGWRNFGLENIRFEKFF